MILNLFSTENWNIKQRFSIVFSFFFSALLGLVLLVILTLFSQFRKEEFTERLIEKAETTVRLLVNVQEVDYQLLKIIDKNTIYRLYNEKTLIFNQNFELIYSSIDDAKLEWTRKDLEKVRDEKTTYEKIGLYDLVGISYHYDNEDYYVLISAEDKYGQNKLTYLKILLTGSFLMGVSGVWFLSFYLSKKTLSPLDIVGKQIREITEKNLNNRLSISERNDEINALARAFNQMIGKIEHSYKSQKAFTGNASHELRTPLARIISQMENVVRSEEVDVKNTEILKSVIVDCYQLSDVVTSLLLLSRLDNKEKIDFKTVRLDEIIFESVEHMRKQYPAFKIQFEIDNQTEREFLFNIKGDDTLLSIAINNLLKNAYNYSDNQQIHIKVLQNVVELELHIQNSGDVPHVTDLNELFNTFKRGSNSLNKQGSGLGLGIVKRIINYHGGDVVYLAPNTNTNLIIVKFKI